jgi:hypothetical protein
MKSIYKLLLAAAPVLFVAACGGGDDSLDDRLDIADPKVRLVHAATISPAVTLYRNNVAQSDATNLSYKGASKYFDVSTGTADWRVATAAGNVEVDTVAFDATRGNKFTLVAVPDAALTGAEVILISDPYDKELTANNARVRVLHASVNAGTVDVYLTPTGTDINTVGPNFGGVAYKAANPASGANSVDFTVGSGSYVLTITATGSKTPVFVAPVTVANNADWLLTILPESVVANDVKVLVVKSDDGAATQEILNTL